MITIKAIVIHANIIELLSNIGNCFDFRIYVKNAFGKLTRYDAITFPSDNLNANAKPIPTANKSNVSLMVLKPGYPK